MSLSLPRLVSFVGCGLATAAFALPLTLTAALAQEEREIVIQRLVVEEKGEKEGKEDDDKKASFWIGVSLKESGEGQMLKIAEVHADSPAKQAGLQADDVLLAVGDNKLERHEQLVDLVQDSKGRTLKIKFLREGKEMVREVKPGKRPGESRVEEKGTRLELKPTQPGSSDWKLEFVPKTGAGTQGAGPHSGSGTMHLYTVPQGAAGSSSTGGSSFPPGGTMPPMMARMTMTLPNPQLPDDMEVTISKKGNKPAVVTVKQGEKLWKTTEKELGMLPPPAQAYAAKLLGKDGIRQRSGMGMPGMPGMGGMSGMSGGMMPATPVGPAMEMGRMKPAPELRHFELRLDRDGKVQAVQEGQNSPQAPQVKVFPGGGIQLEIHEGKEAQKDGNAKKPAAEKDDPAREERIRDLQKQAEQLRDLLHKLREEVKEKE